MTQRAYDWDPRPPTKFERIICGVWLAAFVPCMINHYAEWQLFRGYDRLVFGGLLLAGLFLIARLPAVRRVYGVPRPLSYWLALSLPVGVTIIIVLLVSRS